MTYNIGFKDITLRFALTMALGMLAGITQFLPLVVLCIAVMVTAILGICPLYHLLGISTLDW